MSEIDQEYESDVLKMIIHQYLVKQIYTPQDLVQFELNPNQTVWDIATKIYQTSGHKVSFTTIRDVIKPQIGSIKHQIAERVRKAEAQEKARIEAERVRKETEEKARIEAEKVRRETEEKTRIEAEKVRKAAEDEEKSLREAKEKFEREKPLVWEKLVNIIAAQLEENPSEIQPDVEFEYYFVTNRMTPMGDPAIDWEQCQDLLMRIRINIEKEFDIKMPNNEDEYLDSPQSFFDYILNKMYM